MKKFAFFVKRVLRNSWFFPLVMGIGYGILFVILRNKLLFTPDAIGSDAFDLNISLKYYLWNSLRHGILPFWTDKLSGGFPLIAESQIGAFYLPNLLILPFFSTFAHAYNFLFIMCLFLLSLGMYLLLKALKTSPSLAFILALTFTWCGAVSFRWVHFNLLQAYSLTPLLFWAFLNWNRGEKKRYALFIVFLICQMIFAGHMQTTFTVVFGMLLLYIALNLPLNVRKTVHFMGIILIGFLFAAPQIIPTLQLSQFSPRSLTGSYDSIVLFNFAFKDILGFFSSHAWGSPLLGTFGGLQETGYRIYWENTPYFGEIFISILFFASILYFFCKKKMPYSRIFLSFFCFFVILALGGKSPFYFLFSIPPFNMFRTPPKYLLDAVLFLTLYAGSVFTVISKKNIILHIVLVGALTVNCIMLIFTAFQYHVFVDSNTLFKSLYASKIKTDLQLNYMQRGIDEIWNKLYLRGWNSESKVKNYLFVNSSLIPNTNLITGNRAFDIYTGGLRLRRSEYVKALIDKQLIIIATSSAELNSSGAFVRFLQLYNIATVISPHKLSLPNFTVSERGLENGLSISTYRNNDPKGTIFYVPHVITSLSYVEQLENAVRATVISEENGIAELLPQSINQDTAVKIVQTQNDEQYLKSIITVPEKRFIAVKKAWYPEWKLFVDGKESKIYKTNILHMGFFLESGTHRVEFKYVPTSFYSGCVISLLGFVGVIIILKRTQRGK